MKTVLHVGGRVCILGALAGVALLVSDCATPALWKCTAARVWQPESFPDQILATSTTGRQEVVVVFHQSLFISGKTKNRIVGWNLCHAPLELAFGQAALRQLTNSCDRVQIMPVFSQGKVPVDTTSAPPGYAVLDWSWFRFAVHLDGVPSGPYSLPASRQKRRTFWRAAGMPFAVATDAAIVGAAVFSAGGGISVGR